VGDPPLAHVGRSFLVNRHVRRPPSVASYQNQKSSRRTLFRIPADNVCRAIRTARVTRRCVRVIDKKLSMFRFDVILPLAFCEDLTEK
jgi:hypothetical protein